MQLLKLVHKFVHLGKKLG